jgi:hypothetical protein
MADTDDTDDTAAAAAPAPGSDPHPPIDLSHPDAADEVFKVYAARTGADLGLVEARAKTSAESETDDNPTIDEVDKGYPLRDQAQDSARQTITLWLIGIFAVLIVLSFVALFVGGLKSKGGFDKDFFANLKTLLDVLLGPVITLLSSAIGFYFGYQQGSTSPGAKAGGGPGGDRPPNVR